MRFSRFDTADFVIMLLIAFAAGAGPKADAAEEKRLFIYNWTDFIGRNTVAEFQKETGIKVTYDVYDSEETMDARLLAGSSGYDVVIASTEYFGREIKAGSLYSAGQVQAAQLEKPGPANSRDPDPADPGNEYSVPYMHAINGFAYNVDMVKARLPGAPVNSLDMLFKPEVVAKFADCGVTFLDSAADTLMLAPAVPGSGPQYHEARGLQGGGEAVAQGASVCPLLRFLRVLEWIGEPEDLHRDVLVERLCAVQGSRPGRGRQRQPRLYGAEGGGESEFHFAADTRGRAPPGGGLSLHQLHSAAGCDRRDQQRDLLRQ